MNPFDQLQQTIAATLRVAPAKVMPSTSSDDLPAWDSLGQVNLMMALEETFGVYIEVEDFDKLKSVQAILDFLARQGVA